MKKEVRLYTDTKELSAKAKQALQKLDVPFREIDVAEDYVLRGWLAWAQGTRGMPAVFFDGEPYGTGEEAIKFIEEELPELLRPDSHSIARK